MIVQRDVDSGFEENDASEYQSAYGLLYEADFKSDPNRHMLKGLYDSAGSRGTKESLSILDQSDESMND